MRGGNVALEPSYLFPFFLNYMSVARTGRHVDRLTTGITKCREKEKGEREREEGMVRASSILTHIPKHTHPYVTTRLDLYTE